MAKTVVNLSDPFSTFVNKTNTISTGVGDVATLSTTLDSNLTGAVNELHAELGTITTGVMGTTASNVGAAIGELEAEIDVLNTKVEPGQSLTTTASTLSDAVNELDSDIGNRANLTTTNKTDLVLAINSLFSTVATIDSNATNNPVGILSNLTTSAKTNVVAAINEVQSEINTITTEHIQDAIGTMFSGNTETGITVTYDDTDDEIDFVVDATLGTHTTGNYVATIAAGEGIDVSGSGSETAAVTISAEEATDTNKGIASFNSTDFSVSSGAVSLAKDPTVTLTGAVTGSGTMTNLGNVSIATTATSDPTITLAGDLTGSATLTNLGNATLTATIAANSVALGTDTTGHYVSGINGGTSITVSGSGGENVAPTVSVTAGSITSTQLSNATTLQILNSSGSALKTIIGAGN